MVPTGIYLLRATEWTGGAVRASEQAKRIAFTVWIRRLNDNINVSNKVNNKINKLK